MRDLASRLPMSSLPEYLPLELTDGLLELRSTLLSLDLDLLGLLLLLSPLLSLFLSLLLSSLLGV